jgi:hypothetical protein
VLAWHALCHLSHIPSLRTWSLEPEIFGFKLVLLVTCCVVLDELFNLSVSLNDNICFYKLARVMLLLECLDAIKY